MLSNNSSETKYRSLILGVYTENSNKIFAEYANEIHKRSEICNYLNYRQLYLKLGPRKFEEHIKGVIDQNNINHIFIIFSGWDFILNVHFLDLISGSTKIVIFYFDTEYYFENLDRYYAQVADLVVIPDRYSCYCFEELSIPAYTSYALYDSKTKYIKHEFMSKSIDVSFVGNLEIGDRKQYINYLVQNGVRVEIFGAGSPNGFISHEKAVEIYNNSKICLNFTGLQDFRKMPPGIPKIRKRIRQSKGRPIEIALCGGFVLSEYSIGISEMFDIGSQIDLFDSKEELLQKVRYYLLNENVRNEMASSAYVHAKANYDLSNGFEKIFDRLEQSNRRLRLIYLDRIFLIEYSFNHLKLAFTFLISLKWVQFFAEIKLIFASKVFSLTRLFQEFFYVVRRLRQRLHSPNSF